MHNIVQDTSGKIEIEVVITKDQLMEVVQRVAAAEFVALDTETTSLDPTVAKIVGLPLAICGNKAWYIPVGHKPTKQTSIFDADHRFGVEQQLPWDLVREMLEPILRAKKLIFHHAKYDYSVLKHNGFDFTKGFPLYHDTMLAARMIDPNTPAALKWLTEHFLKRKVTRYNELKGGIQTASIEDAARYGGADPANTYALFEKQVLLLNEDSIKVLRDIELPLVTILAEMEETGVLVDLAKVEGLRAICVEEAEKAKQQVQETARQILSILEPDSTQNKNYTLDVNSTKKLSEFFSYIGAPLPTEFEPDFDDPDATFSTNKNVLATIKAGYFDSKKPLHMLLIKIIDAILTYRQHEKIKNTYLDSLIAGKTKGRNSIEDSEVINSMAGGRLHTSYRQLGAKTGRLASAPNLQNLPRNKRLDIRSLLIPDIGKVFVKSDWNAIELRLAAYISKDQTMKLLMQENKDLHAYTAALIHGMSYDQFLKEWNKELLESWGSLITADQADKKPIYDLATTRNRQRDDAKTTSFLILYGGGARKLALNLTTSTGILYTQEQCQAIIDGFLGIYSELDIWIKQTVEDIKFRGYAETIFGRRFNVGQNPSEDQLRTALNSIIQGSAADILKQSLVKADATWKQTKHKVETKLHVHDEIVVQCDDNDDAIAEAWDGLDRAMFWRLEDLELTRELQVVRSLSKSEKSAWKHPKIEIP